MNLTIGLLQQDAGWELLLTQIGASWHLYDATQTMSPDAFAVMIVNAEPTTLQRGGLAEYLHAGGSILADDAAVRFFLDCTTSKTHLTSLAPGDCAPFNPSSILDLYTDGITVLQSRGRIVEGGAAAQIITDGTGTVVSLPFSASRCVLSTQSRRKNFYAPPERLASEVVSTVSKGALRQVVTSALEFLHHRRSLPFVHTWYYPGGHPSLFTFRVDTDLGSEAELQQLYDVCARHRVPGTWFVDVRSQEHQLDIFSSFRDQEIGLHCYDHETASQRDAVYENFSKGHELLREAGFAVHGASAPCGTWNHAVDTVYRELGLTYSSEFSLDYDDLPFYPVVGGAASTILQLPIHPICVGSMKRSRYSPAQMREYFRAHIRNRIASHEPVCIYHHPTHHAWDVFDDVFSYVREMKLPMLSYAAYAAWWRHRIATVPRFTFEHGAITHTNAENGDIDLFYRASLPGGDEVITQFNGPTAIAESPRSVRTAAAEIPADILRARKFDPRHPLINFLDYWYKTTQ